MAGGQNKKKKISTSERHSKVTNSSLHNWILLFCFFYCILVVGKQYQNWITSERKEEIETLDLLLQIYVE